ncbi:uncharacterized protein LOC128882945 isoform X2 [Hylaeus volcanicus]|uniref:uncharacterized protein LOC128882945 isoform X2 n=1 Tax=Hylaeus volcanicus TaxID=313075 RepID=UPI0023B78463|nr:uncharacterized protein LOC128882945 isoform X2 [Hylaeus volcanicus]
MLQTKNILTSLSDKEILISPDFSEKDYVNNLLKFNTLEKTCNLLSDQVCKVKKTFVSIVNNYHKDFSKVSFALRQATQQLPVLRHLIADYEALCSTLFESVHTYLQEIYTNATLLEKTYNDQLKQKVLFLLLSTIKQDLETFTFMKDNYEDYEETCDSAFYTCLEIVSSDVSYSKRIVHFLQNNNTLENSCITSEKKLPEPYELSTPISSKVLKYLPVLINQLEGKSRNVLVKLFTQELVKLQKTAKEMVEHTNFDHNCCEESLCEHHKRLCDISLSLYFMGHQKLVQTLVCDVITYPYLFKSFDKFLKYLDTTMPSLLWIVAPFVNNSIDSIDCSSVENFLQNRNKNIFYEFDVVHICILLPLIKIIQKHYADFFLPVYSEEFLKNFQAVQGMFYKWTLTLMDDKNRSEFLKSETWCFFVNQWKTQSYEAQRCSRHVAVFKKQLVSDEMCRENNNHTKHFFNLEATYHLMNTIHKILDPEKRLIKQYPKLLKTVAHLTLMEYKMFIRENFEKSLKIFNTETVMQCLKEVLWRQDLCCIINDLFFLEAEFSKNVVESSRTTLLQVMLEDMKIDEINCFWSTGIVNDTLTREARTEQRRIFLNKVCAEIACSLQIERMKYQEILEEKIITQTTSYLQAMKGLPALFRLTNRPATGTVSAYIPVAVAPLSSLKYLRNINEVNISAWIDRTLEKILRLYESYLKNVLTTVAVQEESLRRLYSSKQHARSFTAYEGQISTPTDLDFNFKQIKQQLTLDTEEFERQCLSISPSFSKGKKVGSYSHLLTTD